MSETNNHAHSVTATDACTVIQASTVHGGIHLHAPAAPAVAPRQLPPPRVFINRDAELEALERAWAQHPTRIAVWVGLEGISGIGTTALAVRWISEHAQRWPDGQLYTDLAHSDVETALTGWLHALGVTPAVVPHQRDHLVGLWRSVTTQRRVAVLIDNATGTHARLLLPSGPECVGLATGPELADLVAHGALVHHLSPLSRAATRTLLTRLLGPRLVTGRVLQAAARASAGVPLAIGMTAAYLLRHPSTDPDHLTTTTELPVSHRVDALYAHLPAASAQAARVLALHPGPHITTPAAQVLLNLDAATTRQVLHDLVEAELLHDHGQDQFALHDAVRTHLRHRAHDEEPTAEREAALERLIGHYLLRVTAADVLCNPWRWRVSTDLLAHARELQHPNAPWFSDPGHALAWVEAELPTIRALAHLAYDTGHHEVTWQLAENMKHYYTARRPYRLWEELCELGLDAARALSAEQAGAYLRMLLGSLETARHDFPAARSHFQQAMGTWQRYGHTQGIASCLEGLGVTYLAAEDDLETAVELLQQCVAAHEDIGEPRGTALQKRHLAEAYRKTGHCAQAVSLLHQSIAVLAQHGDTYQLARAHHHLAHTHLATGHLDNAHQAATQALASATHAQATYEIAANHVLLADIAHTHGDRPTEHDHLTTALPLLERLAAPETSTIRQRLNTHNSPPPTV